MIPEAETAVATFSGSRQWRGTVFLVVKAGPSAPIVSLVLFAPSLVAFW